MLFNALASLTARGLACAALSCLAATLPMPAVAAVPSTLSLKQAVYLAVERAPILDARRAQVEAAREEAVRADALPDPVLTVGIADLPVTGRGKGIIRT